MKTKLILGMTLFSLSLFPHNGNDVVAETERTIREQLVLQAVNVPADQKVELLFTTNEKGEVNFVLAKTGNSQLKQAIEKNFACLKLHGLKHDMVYGLTLKIKTV